MMHCSTSLKPVRALMKMTAMMEAMQTGTSSIDICADLYTLEEDGSYTVRHP
jgi:hypothetical protein